MFFHHIISHNITIIAAHNHHADIHFFQPFQPYQPFQPFQPDTYPMCVVDAFTDKAYAGNPAAVVFLTAGQDQALGNTGRRKIAAQMNLSETAFVTPITSHSGTTPPPESGGSDGSDFSSCSDFGLRWFTPDGTEVNLCGHATMATATALLSVQQNTSTKLNFHTLSGILEVTRHTGEFASSRSINKPNLPSLLEMVLPYNAPLPIGECEAGAVEAATAIQVCLCPCLCPCLCLCSCLRLCLCLSISIRFFDV